MYLGVNGFLREVLVAAYESPQAKGISYLSSV